MNRILEFQNLIEMLRQLDIDKNDKDTIKYVLNYIADELENYVDDIK